MQIPVCGIKRGLINENGIGVMVNSIAFSVIIPHRSSIETLSKLLGTIPNNRQIEIIVIDNSLIPVTKGEINTDREYTLLYSAPERGAGGARNVGIEHARGEWLIFADADDFFEKDAFNVFYKYRDSDAELIYFCAKSEYIDTGEQASRGDSYTALVNGYVDGYVSEEKIRLGFSVPWCKMVKHSLVKKYNIRFDEVVASNDLYFSMLVGFYVTKI